MTGFDFMQLSSPAHHILMILWTLHIIWQTVYSRSWRIGANVNLIWVMEGSVRDVFGMSVTWRTLRAGTAGSVLCIKKHQESRSSVRCGVEGYLFLVASLCRRR